MRSLPGMLMLLSIACATQAQEAPDALVTQAGCIGCHRADTPMLGPSWQAIADRYRGDREVLEKVRQRIRTGSKGVWGEAPMPPVSPEQLTDEQLSLVLDWVLKR